MDQTQLREDQGKCWGRDHAEVSGSFSSTSYVGLVLSNPPSLGYAAIFWDQICSCGTKAPFSCHFPVESLWRDSVCVCSRSSAQPWVYRGTQEASRS